MDNKTIFLLSLKDYKESDVKNIYSINNESKFILANYPQEASLKAALTLTKIDKVTILLDSINYSLFKDKTFHLKDFSINENNKNNVVINFLQNIKNYILDKENYEPSVNIDSSLFTDKNKENYLDEYFNNIDTREKVNYYLSNKNPNDFLNSIFATSKSRAKSNKDNINLEIIFKLSVKEDNQIINIDSINETIKGIKSQADKVDIIYDTKGLLNSDYHFLSNMLQLADKKDDVISIKGIIDIVKNSKCYIDSVINSKYVPDFSFILSLIKGYSSTSKISTLYKIKKYFNDRNINTIFFDKYISALSFIESGVSLCNISTLKFGINVLKMVHSLPTNSDVDEKLKVVEAIFKSVIDDKFGLLINDDKLKIVNLIEWCINNEYYQQTLTIIESLVPSEMVEKGIIYYAKNKDDANKILEKWNYYYWKELGRTRYIFNDLSHYFIKNYGRNAINNAQPKDKALDDLIHTYLNATKGLVPSLGQFYTNINDEQLLLDLLLSYYKIGNLRNEVAHALPQKEKSLDDLDNLGEDELYSKVRTEIKYFYSLYKKALLISNGYRPYIIFNRTFKEYTSNHRLDNSKK